MAETDFALNFYDQTRPQDDRAVELLGAGIALAAQPGAEQIQRAHQARLSVTERVKDTPGEHAALQPLIDADQIKRLRAAIKAASDESDTPVVFSVTPHAGLTTISTYDYDWHWQAPDTSSPGTSIGDAADGLMTITGESSFPGNAVNAVAGVGFLLEADVFGQAEVRPYIPYSWRYDTLASGAFSHAEASGGLEMSVWRRSDGSLASLQGVHRKQLFRDKVSPGESHDNSGDGVVDVSDVLVDFTIEPGEGYWVNLGAWIICDHNGGATLAPISYGWGSITAHVRFVVIQRFM